MKLKTLSEKKKTSDSHDDDEKDLISIDDLEDGVYLDKDVKECFDRIKKRINKNEHNLAVYVHDVIKIIDEEIGDDFK